jgi:hypothetical protein
VPQFQRQEAILSGPAKPTTFGPGSLESIHLERRRRRPGTDAERLEARVTGTFRIYCGAGNEHTQQIQSEWLVVEWVPGAGGTKGDTQHDFTDADALAHELVEAALEDWSDPCEVDE